MRIITYGRGGYGGKDSPNIIEDIDNGKADEPDRFAAIEARIDALEKTRTRAP